MAKIKQNFMLEQEQIDYLTSLKEKVGVSQAETVRRLINEAMKCDSEYQERK